MSLATTAPPSRPIKILMLHGYTQSGALFQAKTGALRKTLSKAFPAGIDLVYPTAPIRLTPADESFLAGTGTAGDGDSRGKGDSGEKEELDAWAWWRRRRTSSACQSGGADADVDAEAFIYEGIDDCFAALAALLATSGPFDGVIGFSQGAAAAAMLASLLEPGRRAAFEARYPDGGIRYPDCFFAATPDGATAIHPPLRFAVAYSGFAASGGGSPYAAFYEPEIRTPVLHFLGSQDVVVEEKRVWPWYARVRTATRATLCITREAISCRVRRRRV